ncbi:MAG: hypothetical protein GX613_04825 [Chloroflexi bacterium]|jgi:phage shock protein PspC (stress-responsive transcriptional regulator)|nr:hypothetical protein [Chloroflexota bacterium]
MSVQTESQQPQIGRMIGMAVMMVLLLRELTVPRAVLSGVKNVFDVPMDLLRLLFRSLMVFKPLLDLIGSLLAIVRAALILAVFGVVVTKLLDSLGMMKLR